MVFLSVFLGVSSRCSEVFRCVFEVLRSFHLWEDNHPSGLNPNESQGYLHDLRIHLRS